ncbi:MAG TPA: hypothetical protein VGR95_06160 [Thermoanaerobaculia bacterium]|jgi:hypothetical protein|nr:hypothetical protein [Thermoanaerobaculia bacterium]
MTVSPSWLSDKDALETIVRIAEEVAYTFGLIAAIGGVVYFVANHRLKPIEDAELDSERRVIAGKIADSNAKAAAANVRAETIEQDNIKLRGELLVPSRT